VLCSCLYGLVSLFKSYLRLYLVWILPFLLLNIQMVSKCHVLSPWGIEIFWVLRLIYVLNSQNRPVCILKYSSWMETDLNNWKCWCGLICYSYKLARVLLKNSFPISNFAYFHRYHKCVTWLKFQDRKQTPYLIISSSN
jgi:hypothetical protein